MSIQKTKRITVGDLCDMDEVTINIICLNKIHRITLRKRGSITLHNHDHKAEKKLQGLQQALGATTPKCLKILQFWQDKFGRRGYHHGLFQAGRSLPWQVRNMQYLAMTDSRTRKYKHTSLHIDGEADKSQRWQWFKRKISHGLVPRDMNVTSLTNGTMFRVQVNNVWSSWGLAADNFPVHPWLYRIVCSGLAEVAPNEFVPLGVVDDKPDRTSQLLYLSRDQNKIERMELYNGDCPTCLTSSESKAKYLKAVHQYRTLAATLDRDY